MVAGIFRSRYVEFEAGGYAFTPGLSLSGNLMEMRGWTVNDTEPSISTFEGWGSSIGVSYNIGAAGLWLSDDGGMLTPFNPARPFVNKELWVGYLGGIDIDHTVFNKTKNQKKWGAGWSRAKTKVTFPGPLLEGIKYKWTWDWLVDPSKEKYNDK